MFNLFYKIRKEQIKLIEESFNQKNITEKCWVSSEEVIFIFFAKIKLEKFFFDETKVPIYDVPDLSEFNVFYV